MKLRPILTLAALLAATALTATAQVEIPSLINYQGFVTDGSAVPLGDGMATNYDVLFQIYDASSGGNVLWGEMQTVTILDGQFSVLLGNGTAIDQSVPHADLGALFAPGALAAEQAFIGLTVNTVGQTGNPELIPRQQLVANPFALHALNADSAQLAVTVADNSITSASIAAGAVGTAQIANGSVTSISIAANSVGAAQIAANSVGTSEIADESITAADVPWVSTYTTSGSGSGVTFSPRISGAFPGRLTMFNDSFSGGDGSELTFLEISAIGSRIVSRLGFTFTNDNFFIKRHTTDSGRAQLNSSGVWSSSSDARLKTDVTPASGFLDRTLKLEPVHYRFKSDAPSKAAELGFTAQDVGEQFPELVTKGESWSLNYAGLSTVAIGAIKEQNAVVTDQSKQIKALREENEALRSRLDRLEQALLAE